VFSPDGQRLATASDDKTVRLWGLGGTASLSGLTQNRQRSAFGLPEPVILDAGRDAVLSVSSISLNSIAAGGRDGTVRVWYLDNPQKPPLMLRGHNGPVTAVAEAGGRILSASLDGTIRVWSDLAGGSQKGTLQGHSGGVSSLAVSGDWGPLTMASAGSTDHTIHVWMSSSSAENPLILQYTPVLPAEPKLTHDSISLLGSRLLAAGTNAGVVLVWDLSDAKKAPSILTPTSGAEGKVSSVSFNHGRDRLAGATGQLMAGGARFAMDGPRRGPELRTEC